MNDEKPAVAGNKSQRAIGRDIVNDSHLEIGFGLRQQRRHAALQIFTRIEIDDDDPRPNHLRTVLPVAGKGKLCGIARKLCGSAGNSSVNRYLGPPRMAGVVSSRRNHNPVKPLTLWRFEVARACQQWNNCVDNSYHYVHRLLQPFAYRYGDNPWRAPHFRTLRLALPRRLRQSRRQSMRREPLARRLPPRARGDRKARRASVGRGPDRAVDGRCLADEMASRTRHLVLRAIPAGAERSNLQDFRRALSVPVQFLLRRRRSAPCAPATRADHAAERRGCRRLSRACRCGGRAADRKRAGGGRRARVRDPRDRPASRAAAPGIAAHRYPARLRAEPDRSGL